MTIGIMLGLFFLFLLLSIPIGVSLGLAIIISIMTTHVTTFAMLAQAMQTSLCNFPLLAVPFFMLCGGIMETGGLSKRLVAVGDALVGHFTGGTATVAIITCLFFGAISGSAPATVAAIGSIMVPAMVSNNYNKDYAAGLMAVSGGLGVVIPPSIPFVLYGLATGASVGTMFIAGVAPGFLLAGLLIFVSTFICHRRGYKGNGERFSWKKFGHALWDAKWALLVPVIILGGIYGGIFTPTEAAVVACVYGLIVGFFIYRELKLRDMPKMLINNGLMVGSVIMVLATATAIGTIFTMLGVPQAVANGLMSISGNKWVIMLIINLFLLIVGMLMDVAAAILILAPLLAGVCTALGFSIVQFGIIMTVNLAIGFVTPPVAVSLYVASGVSGVSPMKIAKQAVPFIITFLLGLFFLVAFPQISLWLPSLMS